MNDQKIIIYADGGSRGNPGPSACGVVLKDATGKVISNHSKYLGEATNNQAEYNGVILGLTEALKITNGEIDFYLDSLLAVNQLNQTFKVKNAGIQTLFVKAWNLSVKFKKVKFFHIPREQNKEADKLVNIELDNNK
ncbi:ribonuclease HI family protein [bacterium]|jgi:ribonuclease HI|nr:ribonuclease HI family protein [bacterium]MBT4121607.1 ribonuclease HI family protein [bacterium]MBT4334995.1 ribonuclease HI family protein [bacterium]MBT4496054.1 ribonuclease HI family protein [bacterium]MBT4764017.1 ribonuclease HI family protein [bacterium]